MTIPDIPIPPTFEATHTTTSGSKVQALATYGNWIVARYSDTRIDIWLERNLTPLPPPLPKARVGWYVLDSDSDLTPESGPDEAWRYADAYENRVVVKLCADGVLRHVDRDGIEGAPLEVEQ